VKYIAGVARIKFLVGVLWKLEGIVESESVVSLTASLPIWSGMSLERIHVVEII
jgi:hypothetical protein